MNGKKEKTMAVQSVTAPRFKSTDLTQEHSGKPPFLQLPVETLTAIGGWVAGPRSPENGIRFSRVCVLTYEVAQDKKIQDLVKEAAIEDLAKATAERRVTVFEMCHFGSFSEPSHVRLEEKTKIRILYALFKKTTVEPNNDENSRVFATHSLTIQQCVRERYREMTKKEIVEDPYELEWIETHLIEKKIHTALRSFTEKTIKDIIAGYVSQPLEKITQENFESQSARLQKLFEEVKASWDAWPQEFYPTFIEQRIRKEILAKHESEQFKENGKNHFVFDPLVREWMSYGKNVVY